MAAYGLAGSQIESLSTERFVAFLNDLLQAERAAQRLPIDALTVTSRINDRDGGVDARFTGANGSSFVTAGDSVWQFKLSPPGQALSKQEVNKSATAAAIAAGAHYYLVIGKDSSDQVVEARRRWLAEATGQPDHIHVYNASHLAEWASSYPSVLVRHGFATYLRDIWSYSQWSDTREHRSIFVPDDGRAALIERLHTALGAAQPIVIRIEGAPGSGKTRMALEGLRNEEFAPLVVYAPQAEEVPNHVLTELATMRERSIVVLDECDRQTHSRLTDAVPDHAELRMITIGSDASVRDPAIEHINVPGMDRFWLERVVAENFPAITDTRAAWAADAADGSVRLALTLARRILETSETDLASIIGKGDVTQLLRLTLPTGERLAAAQVAALMRRFGWSDEHHGDIEALAQFSGLTPGTFRNCIEGLTADGVVLRQGRMRYVSPLPLAVHLAARRWEDAPAAIVNRLLPALSPEGQDALLARAADLGRYPPATTALGRLLAVDGPFGSLSALEDGWRASMLRYLAATNPEQTLTVLEIITNATTDELRAASRSRRALVDAVEKIAWNPEMFERAADVLLRLALAENEAMSNNASGVFAQLFSGPLPATAAPPMARLQYLRSLAASSSQEQLRLALSALNSGLLPPQMRVMTAEQQYGHAAKPPGFPSTPSEFRDYFGGLMDILRVLISSESEVSWPALITAMRSVRVFLGTHAEDRALDLAEWIAEREPRAVRVGSQEWYRFREQDGGTPQAWQRIEALLASIEPTDPVERLIDVASRQPESIATQHSEIIAAYVAELQAVRRADRLSDALGWLPSLTHRNGALLAAALATTASEPEADWTLLNQHTSNTSVLGAYLGHLDHASLPDVLVDAAHSHGQISDRDAAHLSLVGPYNQKALYRVQRLLDAGLAPAAVREGLLFSGWLRTLGLRKFAALYGTLRRAVTTDEDRAVLLEVLHSHLYAKPEHLTPLNARTRAAVVDYPLGDPQVAFMSMDSWFALARVVASQAAAAIAEKVFRLAAEDRINLLRINEVGEVVALCAQEQPEAVWTAAVEVSMGADGPRLIPRIAGWLIAEFPNGLVRRWVEENSAQLQRARIAAQLAPVYGDHAVDLVVYLLTTFPDDEVRRAIEASLWRGGGQPGPMSIAAAIRTQIDQLRSWGERSPVLRPWTDGLLRTLQQRLLDARQAEAEARSSTFHAWN